MQSQHLFRLPKAILGARRKKALSQKALALEAGIDDPRLSALEHGRSVGPGGELVERLADALSMSEIQKRELRQAAAHDRVMREIVKNVDEDSCLLLALSLDAARLLTPMDRAALTTFIQQLVGPRAKLAYALEGDAMT